MGFFQRLFGGGNKPSAAAPVSAPAPAPANALVLDCRNQNCPMPIVNISRKFKDMEVGQNLQVSATDPAFRADLEAWIRKTGNELVSFHDGADKVAMIKKLN